MNINVNEYSNDYNIICYSHTDYLDILTIQNSYLQKYTEEKILLINENLIKDTSEFIEATSGFTQILYYDDSLNYTKKIYTTLSNIVIKTQNVIFIHDNDILFQKKHENIKIIIDLMNKHNIHRVDFQNWYHSDTVDDIIPAFDNVTLQKTLCDGYYYNVNPSIWKLDCLLDVMNNIDKKYRDVEYEETQLFCKSKYNFYRLYNVSKIEFTILYRCTDTFVAFHITNYGKLIHPNTKLNYKGEHYSFDETYFNEYVKILNNFKFKDRQMNPSTNVH